MNGTSALSRAGVPVRSGRTLGGHAGERTLRAVPVGRQRNGRGKVSAGSSGRLGSPTPSTSHRPPGSFVRRLGGGLRVAVRAAAWLMPILFVGLPGLLGWTPAHGTAGPPPSEEQSAEKLALILMQSLRTGSTVVVRPLSGGHTGLPESVAERLQGLIVRKLSSSIPEKMNVTLITGDNVHHIYRTLDEASVSQSSEKLLESVLQAARANTVLVCAPGGSGPESFDILCSLSHGELACPDGGAIQSCEEDVEVGAVRSLGTAEARFPWRRPSEYRKHVFTELAWKLAKEGRLKGSDVVEVRHEEADTGGKTEPGKLGRYVTKNLHQEMVRAKRQNRVWRGVGGEGRRFRLVWSVQALDEEQYTLWADLYEALPEGPAYHAGVSTDIMISALPRGVRLPGRGTGPTEDPQNPEAGQNGTARASSPGADEAVAPAGGLRVSDWLLLAEDRLARGDHRNLLVEGAALIRARGANAAVEAVVERALASLLAGVRLDDEAGAREALATVERIRGVVSERAALARVEAEAHHRLGQLDEAVAAYRRWLDLAPEDHSERKRMLLAMRGAKRAAAEGSLELTPRERALIRWGLGAPAGAPEALEGAFDDTTRSRIGAWQEARGAEPTGYLTTREEAQALMAKGRAAEERAQDDAAFARAKAADTAEAYRTYLSKFPKGRYVEEARQRLEAIRAREDDAAFEQAKRADTEASYAAYLSQYPEGRHAAEARRLREAARARGVAEAEEVALALTREQREFVERGLAAVRSGGGRADGEFDAAFRGALRSWQASKGDQETGYLTAEQAKTLMDKGRKVDERKKDDAAFARAKTANTVASYTSYLTEFPNGRHVAEARRRLEAIRAREDDAAFARAKQADTEASYAAYLSRYPEGRHVAEARRLREAARVREVAAAEEEALDLTWAERELVQRGLASRVRSGAVNGRFHAAFRTALRSWQASNGHTATGYLTRGQAKALMDLGRDVEKRERDDAAFELAKRTDTVASYTAYLSAYPNGRHAAVARRLREAAREEEERRKAEAPAEVERAMGLTREQRKLVQYGLVSKGYEIGGVDGVLGPRSRAAIRSHQGREGLTRTGYLTAELSRTLQALGKEYVKRRRAAVAPKMERIRGGCFQMGSPGSETGRQYDERRHRVCVDDFRIGKHEVTRGEWRRFVQATGHSTGDGCWTYESGEWKERSGRSWRTPGFSQSDGHPVVCVSWADAKAYARWVSGETGQSYRLPTEAEWEYAARGGTTTSRHWGDAWAAACTYANVADRTLKRHYPDWEWSIHECRDGYVHTAPVGEFRANGYGLHDMLGNVWEWTCSEYDSGYGGAERKCASGSSGRRVIRGGSWYPTPWSVRSADRDWNDTGYRSNILGFRLAQD